MSTFAVKNVGAEPREWKSSHGGTFLSYKVDLQEEGGPLAMGVEWNKKAESQPPTEGELVAGHLEEGKFGDKFKIDYEATKELGRGSTGSAGSKTTSTPTARGSWQPESERDPERAARILRQHSQGLAVQVLGAMGSLDSKDAPTLHRWIKDWSDFFDRDVNAAGEAAKQAAGNATPGARGAEPYPSSASPPPASPPADDTHQFLCTIIETAGLAAYPASKLADFVVSKLNPEQRKRAETGLSDLDTAGATLAKLKTAYEAAEGPLPEADTGAEDLPF